MKIRLVFLSLLVFVGLVCAATPVSAQTKFADLPSYRHIVIEGITWTVPDYVDISAFPPLGGKVTERDARLLNLHKEPLMQSEAGYYVNEIRSRHTFEVVWLDAGTDVWFDNGSGRDTRYLVSCGNRIARIMEGRIGIITPTPTPPKPVPAVTPPKIRLRAPWAWLLDLWVFGPFLTAR